MSFGPVAAKYRPIPNPVPPPVVPFFRIVTDPASIVPGQDFSILWDWKEFSPQLATGSISVTFSIARVIGRNVELIPITSNPVVVELVPDGAGLGSGAQSTHINRPTDQVLLSLMYSISEHDIVLNAKISGTKFDGSSYEESVSTNGVLVVSGEPVDGSWFNWATPNNSTFDWKSPIVLKGEFTNKSLYSDMTCPTIMLNLTDQTDGTTSQLPMSSPAPIPHSTSNSTGSVDLATPQVVEEWQWMDQTLYSVDGALSKNYVFSLEFVLRDEFGNVYSGDLADGAIAGPSLAVVVAVPDKKFNFCTVAMSDMGMSLTLAGTAAAAAVLAAITAEMPPVSAGFAITAAVAAAGATALQVAAQGAAANANDPPVPDPLTRVVEPVEFPQLPQLVRVPKGARPLVDFATRLVGVTNLHSALSRNQSRQLGARLWKDAAGERIQVANRALLLRQLRRVSSGLVRDSERAGRAFAGVLRPLLSDSRTMRMRPEAITVDERFRETFLSCGLSAQLAPKIGIVVSTRSVLMAAQRIPTRLKDVGVLTHRIAMSTLKTG